jgi:hypothetical protein
VSVEANGVVGNHAEQHSRGRLRGLLAAGKSAEELRVQIAQFQAEFAEANTTARQNAEELRSQIAQLRDDFEQDRQRRFLRRLLGLRPRPLEDTEKTREKMRGRLAVGLVFALVALMALTFLYLLILSRGFGTLTTDDLISLIPMVGTTLLTPLVGLIGAVMGFYYGGQTAVSAASQTAEATKQATQTASAATKTASDTAAQAASRTFAHLTNGVPRSSGSSGVGGQT